MFLGKSKFCRAQGVGFQPGVYITLEREHGLFGIIEAKRRMPVHKALMVEVGNFLAYAHQFANILGRHGSGVIDQPGGVLDKLGLGFFTRCRRCIKVQRLGRRYYSQHIGFSVPEVAAQSFTRWSPL